MCCTGKENVYVMRIIVRLKANLIEVSARFSQYLQVSVEMMMMMMMMTIIIIITTTTTIIIIIII
jgi:hypothetical protein